MADLRWHGDEVKRAIHAELERRLKACAVTVTNRARALLSAAGTGARTRGGGVVPKASGAKGRTVYGAFPSAPGAPPAKQTGHLRRSVAWEVVGLVARVGTNLRYGRFLELGCRNLAARPWLRRALAECRAEIRRILSAPMR